MAAKKSLTTASLEAIGATRLAELLLEIASSDVAVKRRLLLELAGHASPRELAATIRKRLATIGRSRSFVEWQSRSTLVSDLESQHRAIADSLAKADPTEALDLIWRFVALAEGVVERCDDRSGIVVGVFEGAVASLGRIALDAKAEPRDLADRAYQALLDNGYGQFDTLVAALAPALGATGLDHLKERMLAVQREPARELPEAQRQRIGWSSVSGPIYADDFEDSTRRNAARLALQEIADAQGDADGFIAQFDAKARQMPKIAAEIATRLLAAGRTEAALQAIEAAQTRNDGWPVFEWEDARIAVLDALGRSDDAQSARWHCFARSLSRAHLREYLKRLPDFEDVDAELRALALAQQHTGFLAALAFLTSWPALDRAAAMVEARAAELDGNHYEILSPSADALAGRYKLASSLLLRAMIDFTLAKARTSRYGHAARHLSECAGLATGIADFGACETHDAYVSRLRATHGRKAAFWGRIA